MKQFITSKKNISLSPTTTISLCRFSPENYAEALNIEPIELPTQVLNSVESRKAEYIAGRMAARNALKMHDLNPHPIISSKEGYPIWPKDIAGSISHTRDYAVSIVQKDLSSAKLPVGIDIEEIFTAPLEPNLTNIFCTSKEASLLRMLSEEVAFTLIFSAKESIYKAIYPQIHHFFGFECAKLVHADIEAKYLIFNLSIPYCSQRKISVSFDHTEEHVLTYKHNLPVCPQKVFSHE